MVWFCSLTISENDASESLFCWSNRDKASGVRAAVETLALAPARVKSEESSVDLFKSACCLYADLYSYALTSMTFMLFCCAQIESKALKANITCLIISSILGDCLNLMVLMKALSKCLPRICAACISKVLSPNMMKFDTPSFVMSARVNRKAWFFHFCGSPG